MWEDKVWEEKIHVPASTCVCVCRHGQFRGPGAKYEKDPVYPLREGQRLFV